MKAKLSIIISTYNDEKYIEKALKSVLLQKFPDWEMILINDASTDRTEQIITRLLGQDRRVKYIKNSQRKGLTKNIQTALRYSNTDLIARLDTDDYWISDRKLEEQYKLFQNDINLGVVGTWAKMVNSNEEELYTACYSDSDEKIRQKILSDNMFVNSSVMFRKPEYSLDKILENESYVEDYNLWLEIGKYKKFFNIAKFYTAYRINPVGISQTRRLGQFKNTILLVKKYRKYYPRFSKSIILWELRKYYPAWLTGKTSMQIKKVFNYY